MKYDCIVIGAGISGMTAALVTTRHGLKTALIEKSGATSPTVRGFERQGVFFDTGFHYTGGLGPGEPLSVFFRYLGLSDRIKALPFREDGFDLFRCLDPPFEFSFPSGYDRIRERLLEAFPGQGEAVDRYLGDVKHAYHSQPYINLDVTMSAPGLSSIHEPSLREYLDGITGDPMLKCLLSVHCLLHGVFPDEASFSGHAFVAASYYQSVHGIRGGGKSLVKAFDERLRESGVDVFCGDGAEEILLSSDLSVSGVRCASGEILESSLCIATVHPGQIPGLVPDSAFRPAYRKRLAALEDTFSAVIAYVKSPVRLTDLDGRNTFLFSTPSFPLTDGSDPMDRRPLFIARVAQDPDKGAQAYVIICPAPPMGSAGWQAAVPSDDAEAYGDYKRSALKMLLDRFKAAYPELANNIARAECATQRTIMRYANSPTGALYGVKHRAEQYNPAPVTRVKNLFLAGQSITAPGILGAAVSAFLACGYIFGHENLREELRQWT